MPQLWAVQWISQNRLDGRTVRLMWDKGLPALFPSRAQARAWVNERYGYVGRRPDLRAEPHGWRRPRPVKVQITELD